MVVKIISGGQTGADQGGLIAAYEIGIPTGGFAPRRFLTELGYNPVKLKFYNLVDSGLDYTGRTRMNVECADVTIWFGYNNTPGYKATVREANRANKLFINVTGWSPEKIAHRLKPYHIVNVAGNRESKNRGICKTVYNTLKIVLSILKEKK